MPRMGYAITRAQAEDFGDETLVAAHRRRVNDVNDLDKQIKRLRELRDVMNTDICAYEDELTKRGIKF